MASVLDFGLSGPGSLAGVVVLCSWAGRFSHSASLHPRV